MPISISYSTSLCLGEGLRLGEPEALNRHLLLVLQHSLISVSTLCLVLWHSLFSVTTLLYSVMESLLRGQARIVLRHLCSVLYCTFGYLLFCVPLIHCYRSMQANTYMLCT